ncbi:uncharacterized protein PFLUO_LOCUS1 [Penicillium psychrofluorescens]|uniref:uncharacterized protein n=1 Tax=Penicillium psychrofluorescens TaxID=3158075 RepID=UPI003CCE478F
MDTSEDCHAVFHFTAAEAAQPSEPTQSQQPVDSPQTENQGQQHTEVAGREESNPFTPLSESIYAPHKRAQSKKVTSKASSRRSKASSGSAEVRKSRRIVDKIESANQASNEYINIEDLERQLQNHQRQDLTSEPERDRQSDGEFQPSSIGSSALTEINTNTSRSGAPNDKPNYSGKENQPIFGRRANGGNPRKRRLTETEINITATRTRLPTKLKQRNNRKSLSKSLRQ